MIPGSTTPLEIVVDPTATIGTTTTTATTAPPSTPRVPRSCNPITALIRLFRAVSAAVPGLPRLTPRDDFTQARVDLVALADRLDVDEYMGAHPRSSPLLARIELAVPQFPHVIARLVEDYLYTKADAIRARRQGDNPPDIGTVPVFWQQMVAPAELQSPPYRRLGAGAPELRRGAIVLAVLTGTIAAVHIVLRNNDGRRIEFLHFHPSYSYFSRCARADVEAMLTRGMYTTDALSGYDSCFPSGGTPPDELAARGKGTRICWFEAGETTVGAVTHFAVLAAVRDGVACRNCNDADDEVDQYMGFVPLKDQQVWVNPLYDHFLDLKSVPSSPLRIGTGALPLPDKAEMGFGATEAYRHAADFRAMFQDTCLVVEAPDPDSKGGKSVARVDTRYEGFAETDGTASKDTIVLSFDSKDSVPPHLARASVAPQGMIQPTDGRHCVWLKLPLPPGVAITPGSKADVIRKHRAGLREAQGGTIAPFWLKHIPVSELRPPRYQRLGAGAPQLRRGAVVLAVGKSRKDAVPTLICERNDRKMVVLFCQSRWKIRGGQVDLDMWLKLGVYTTAALESLDCFPPGGTPLDELDARGYSARICWPTRAVGQHHIEIAELLTVGRDGVRNGVRGGVLAATGTSFVYREEGSVWADPFYDPYLHLKSPPAPAPGATELDKPSRPPRKVPDPRKQLLLDECGKVDLFDRFELPASLVTDGGRATPTAWATQVVQNEHGRFQHIVVRGELQPKLAELCDAPPITGDEELWMELGSQYTTGMKAVGYVVRLDDDPIDDRSVDLKSAPSSPSAAAAAVLPPAVKPETGLDIASAHPLADLRPRFGMTYASVEALDLDDGKGGTTVLRADAWYENFALIDGVYSKDTIMLSFFDADSVPWQLARANVAPKARAPRPDGRHRIWLKLPLPPGVVVTLLPKADAIRRRKHERNPPAGVVGPLWLRRSAVGALQEPLFQRLEAGALQLRRGAVVLTVDESSPYAYPMVIASINDREIEGLYRHATLPIDLDNLLERGVYTTASLEGCDMLPPGGTPLDELEARGPGTWLIVPRVSEDESVHFFAYATLSHIEGGVVHAVSGELEQPVWVDPLRDPYMDILPLPSQRKIGATAEDLRTPPTERDMKSRPAPKGPDSRKQLLLDACKSADYGDRFELPASLRNTVDGARLTAWRKSAQTDGGPVLHIVVEGELQTELAGLCDPETPPTADETALKATLGSQYTPGMKAVRYTIKLPASKPG